MSDYDLTQYNATQCHGLPSTAAHVLHSLPSCRLVLGGIGGLWTAAVIKPQEVSLLLLQTPGDDLVHFSSFAGLVVTLHVFVFSMLLVTNVGCVAFSGLKISAYSTYVHCSGQSAAYALKRNVQ